MPMRLIRLDSLGVTCEMIEVRIASRRRVMQVTSMIGVEFLQVDVAVRLADRTLGLEIFGVDEALDHDLGSRPEPGGRPSSPSPR